MQAVGEKRWWGPATSQSAPLTRHKCCGRLDHSIDPASAITRATVSIVSLSRVAITRQKECVGWYARSRRSWCFGLPRGYTYRTGPDRGDHSRYDSQLTASTIFISAF